MVLISHKQHQAEGGKKKKLITHKDAAALVDAIVRDAGTGMSMESTENGAREQLCKLTERGRGRTRSGCGRGAGWGRRKSRDPPTPGASSTEACQGENQTLDRIKKESAALT
jgi:hypothetical protein